MSGTVDESIRHAITKIASVHFAATEKSKAIIHRRRYKCLKEKQY
nr:UDP-N-acetyl glucosamine 2-epimerase [Enterococcus faecium]